MAKRLSQDIKPENANPRKTKKRLARKHAMLEERKAKKEANKKTWLKKK
jgi:hypothetical protein